MNHIVRLSVSAPVRTAQQLAPLAAAIMVAIDNIAKDRGIEVLMDIDLNALDPKAFSRNWDKRQRELAEDDDGRSSHG